MPTYLYAILSGVIPGISTSGGITGFIQRDAVYMILLLMFLVTFLLPLICVILLFKTIRFSKLELGDKSQRIVPLFYTTLFYILNLYMFSRQFSFGDIFIRILAGITAAVIVTFILSFFSKISLHSVGAGGLMGFLFFFRFYLPHLLPLWIFCVAVLLAGLIVSARLALQCHTLKEVTLGFLVGMCGGGALGWG
ncbi:MAG: hypothetical protein A3H98_03435 [Bacteroidetes bacterium RIFCSPLOWO2_02_FULL_36_8]|nr:MAG: hypothetical protein A3H98_03435 [Bacteroidetes bacterium RIFCSPLOWO2_02_FULL_36_8]OFY69495.1 MAG: hypothetical protein A3G23_10680 [Bacteroidetes bacterium RIFCSPLOWO2_12_FULL_37_12]